MQLSFYSLTEEWTSLADIISITSDSEYRIQNRGADMLIALESDSLPDADSQEGQIIIPYQTGIYKKGEQDLYLRAFNKGCTINISEVG